MDVVVCGWVREEMRRAAWRKIEHGPGMGSQASWAGAHVRIMGGSEWWGKAEAAR